MSLIFCRSSKLAILATCYLAQQAPGKLTPVHEIAERLGVSATYLAKVLQRLVVAGLVRSFRGPGKGMELGSAPETIPLSSIRNAMEGAGEWSQCVLGLDVCSDENPCGFHFDWLPMRSGIRGLLEKTTLADLVHSIDRHSTKVETNVCL